MSKNSFKLSDLDFNNIGAWPQKVKMVFLRLGRLFYCHHGLVPRH